MRISNLFELVISAAKMLEHAIVERLRLDRKIGTLGDKLEAMYSTLSHGTTQEARKIGTRLVRQRNSIVHDFGVNKLTHHDRDAFVSDFMQMMRFVRRAPV